MKTITTGVFHDTNKAEQALTALVKAGVPDSNVSYLYQNKEGELEQHNAEEAVDQAGGDVARTTTDGAAAGAVTGGAIGAVAGFVVATGIVPGLGAIAVAGPIGALLGIGGPAATAVTGAAVGAAAGGLVGALTSYGVSGTDAHLYEDKIRGGEILIVVESDHEGVGGMLTEHGANLVRTYQSEV